MRPTTIIRLGYTMQDRNDDNIWTHETSQKQNHTEQATLYCARPIWRSYTIDDIDVVYHLMGWQYAGTRKENVDIQSVHPAMIRSFRRCCIDAWNPFTVSCRTISAGSLLYTQIKPNALRRSISRKCSLRMSISCLLCRQVPDLVQGRSVVDSLKTYESV